MKVQTKFGTITSIEVMNDPERVQIIHFDREGNDHTHPRWEHAVCLSGACDLIIDGQEMKAIPNAHYMIRPNTPHRMRPTTDEQSIWLIWYSDTA